MLAAVVLGLASYHMIVDKSTIAPIDPNLQWMHLVKALIPFSMCWLLLSILGIYISMSRKLIWSATVVFNIVTNTIILNSMFLLLYCCYIFL